MSDESIDQKRAAARAREPISDRNMFETLERISFLATEAMPGAAYAGITMMVEGEPRTGVFTDEESPEIDQAQYDSGEGPCLDAFRTGEIFRIESTDDDPRWPAFCAACRDHGIQSTASFPIYLDDMPFGALNLYSHERDSFGPEELRAGRAFAAQAAMVIGYARSYMDARRLSDQLQRAIESRAEIEQAKGIIVANTRCTPDQAFDVLVRQSQHENRKLREVAIEIVQRASRRS
jgi:GAF domain-containing protein